MCGTLYSQFGDISKKWAKESLKNKISFANDSITVQVCGGDQGSEYQLANC